MISDCQYYVLKDIFNDISLRSCNQVCAVFGCSSGNRSFSCRIRHILSLKEQSWYIWQMLTDTFVNVTDNDHFKHVSFQDAGQIALSDDQLEATSLRDLRELRPTVRMHAGYLRARCFSGCGCANPDRPVIDHSTRHILDCIVFICLITKSHKAKTFGPTSQGISYDLHKFACFDLRVTAASCQLL